MKERLQNIIAQAGIASRRGAAKLIEDGAVEVDGEVVLEKGFRVDPGGSTIMVNKKPVTKAADKYYFLFYKPKDVISTSKDTHKRKTIVDFFERIDARLYPVGRLDKDTTGIILVTNDGELTNLLTHPRYNVNKEYIAKISPPINDMGIRELEQGVYVEDKLTSPCEVTVINSRANSLLLKIKIHEGRKRQIRKMIEVVGSKVQSLKRVKFAGLTLKGLEPGEYRELSMGEVNKLKNNARKSIEG